MGADEDETLAQELYHAMLDLWGEKTMSCEYYGHKGAEDHHNQPKFRCFYCGSWGYDSKWYDYEKEEYEECDCDGTYDEHWTNCD